MRFVGMATREKVEVTANALRALHAPVFEAYDPLVQHAGAEDLIIRSGQLYVYETEEGLEDDRFGGEMRRARGVEVQELDADAIRQLEPALAPIYRRGVYLSRTWLLPEPTALGAGSCRAVYPRRRHRPAPHRNRVRIGPDGPPRFRTEVGEVEASDIVIAAGAWSHKLTAKLGHRPTLPDSLPVIGRATRFSSVYYAFGHGHTGVSGSPVTGRIISDLVARRPPEIDISPFRIDRF